MKQRIPPVKAAENIYLSHYVTLFDSDSDKGEEILVSLLSKKMALHSIAMIIEECKDSESKDIKEMFDYYTEVKEALVNIEF